MPHVKEERPLLSLRSRVMRNMSNGTKEAKLTIGWSLGTGLIKESTLMSESTAYLRLRVSVPWRKRSA